MTKTMIADILLGEKLFILRGIANKDDEAFVYDKDFEIVIRKTLNQLSRNLETDELRAINTFFSNSFEIYHLGVIRALLSNLHFLRVTADLKNQFEELFEVVAAFVKDKPREYELLLQELELFSDIKLKVTEEFIAFLNSCLSYYSLFLFAYSSSSSFSSFTGGNCCPLFIV